MKPLTPDELKALEVGDWVWIVKDNIGSYGKIEETYNFITQKKDKRILAYDVYVYIGLDGYGTTWLAYKNKEQAEGIDEIKRFAEYVGSKIAGHGDYHGDSILSALYCAAEGKEISDIKPLEAKGEIVELPCKVGDKIYVPWVWKGQNDIMTLTCNSITLTATIHYIKCYDFETDDNDFGNMFSDGTFQLAEYRYVWFTDKTEAERRLAELKGELRK